MGYLFLVLAIIAGLIKAYCGKRSSSAVNCTSDTVAVTTVRMTLCCIIGAFLMIFSGADPFSASKGTVILAMLSGVSSASFTVIWLLSVKNTLYMMVEVFVAGGILIPLVFSSIIYQEVISPADIIGILLLLIGVYFISNNRAGKRERISVGGILLLLLCMISSGSVDLLQKIFVKELPGENTLVFNFYLYVFASIALILVNIFLYSKKMGSVKDSALVIKQIWLYILVMAISLFLNSYFKTAAAAYLDAVVMYPLSQGTAMLLSTVMSVVIFKEALSKKGVLGIILTLIAIVTINIL